MDYKELYKPGKTPEIVEVEPTNFLAMRGTGGTDGDDFQKSKKLLNEVANTLKMSARTGYPIEGFYDFIVPPLEALWWKESGDIDYAQKEGANFIAMIRLPAFVKEEDFEWAIIETTRMKNNDYSNIEFFTYDEGPSVQVLQIGPYSNVPDTVEEIDAFAVKNGYEPDITKNRHHHEIYLTDMSKGGPRRLRTIVRHPVKKNS